VKTNVKNIKKSVQRAVAARSESTSTISTVKIEGNIAKWRMRWYSPVLGRTNSTDRCGPQSNPLRKGAQPQSALRRYSFSGVWLQPQSRAAAVGSGGKVNSGRDNQEKGKKRWFAAELIATEEQVDLLRKLLVCTKQIGSDLKGNSTSCGSGLA
jgi:hypothetical protein